MTLCLFDLDNTLIDRQAMFARWAAGMLGRLRVVDTGGSVDVDDSTADAWTRARVQRRAPPREPTPDAFQAAGMPLGDREYWFSARDLAWVPVISPFHINLSHPQARTRVTAAGAMALAGAQRRPASTPSVVFTRAHTAGHYEDICSSIDHVGPAWDRDMRVLYEATEDACVMVWQMPGGPDAATLQSGGRVCCAQDDAWRCQPMSGQDEPRGGVFDTTAWTGRELVAYGITELAEVRPDVFWRTENVSAVGYVYTPPAHSNLGVPTHSCGY